MGKYIFSKIVNLKVRGVQAFFLYSGVYTHRPPSIHYLYIRPHWSVNTPNYDLVHGTGLSDEERVNFVRPKNCYKKTRKNDTKNRNGQI